MRQFLRSGVPTAVVAACVLALGVSALIGQTFEAQMTGTIKDASGAVVPNAQVMAINLSTQTPFKTISNEAGIFRFPSLPPAQYKFTCSFRGFKTYEQGPFTLQVAQVLELNVALQPGETTEQITITDAPPAIETASSTLGQVVTTRSIANLPLNVRDPLALLALTPGVVIGSSFGNGGGQDVGRNFMKSDFYVGGGRSGSQEILLDGAPNTTADVSRNVIDPPVDSVQEFKVQANSFDAQYGRTSGAVINIVTKTGTSDYHGTGYDYERHSVFDANDFFNNRSGVALASFQRHQFGGNVSGPIVKGKWFLFGDYEGLRQGYPASSISTVPTDLQKQGDFSQTYASNGTMITVYDPATTFKNSSGVYQRTAFPGNKIPSSRFDTVANNTLSYFASKNLTGDPVTGASNYIFSQPDTTNGDKYDVRSDVNLSDRTRLFGRFSRQDDLRFVPGTMPLPAGGGRATNDVYTQGVANLNRVLSPNTVLEVQGSWTRGLAAQYGISVGFDQTTLGFSSALTKYLLNQFPIFSISDTISTAGNSDAFSQYQPRNTFSLSISVNHQHGRHSLKMGAERRELHFNEMQNSAGAGSYGFGRTFTQGPTATQSSTTAGYGFASFLLGAATSGSVTQANSISTQGRYYAAYVQDDWKVSDRLTVNLGFRWDVNIGDAEKYNRLAFFEPGVASPIAAASGLTGLMGQVGWVGKENNPNQQSTDALNLGPRVGFAYSLNHKTVFRGGYGMFLIPHSIIGYGNGALEAYRTTSMNYSVDGVTLANTLSNPFPSGILPALNDRDPLANYGQGLTAPVYNGYKSAYSQMWSIGLQRELPWGMVLDAHYWGSKDNHLLVTWGVDQMPNQYLSLRSSLSDTVTNPFYGVITTGTITGKTISRKQSLLPYPQYTSISQIFTPAGNANFNAGTVALDKRISGVVTFGGSYTRDKALDDAKTPNDYYNRKIEKSVSIFNTPDQFTAHAVVDLPFGHGRHFGAASNTVVNAVLGNWDASAMVSIHSGHPIGVSRTAISSGKSAYLGTRNVDKWFDTSQFTICDTYGWGTVGPYLPDVSDDGAKNLDMVLTKSGSVKFGERKITVQFRAEAYNVFNHVKFGAPTTSITSTSFGKVTSMSNSPRDLQFALRTSF